MIKILFIAFVTFSIHLNAAEKYPLHDAVSRGDIAAVKELLGKNKNPNEVRDRYRKTPFHDVVFSPNPEIVQILLAAGGHIEAKDYYGRTPLHLAAHKGRFEVAQALITAGAHVDAKKNREQTPLHLALSCQKDESSKLEVAKILIESGADIHAKDDHGQTPLHYAVLNGSSKRVKLLIESGADIHAKNIDSQTPLHYAISNGNIEIQNILRNSSQHSAINNPQPSPSFHRSPDLDPPPPSKRRKIAYMEPKDFTHPQNSYLDSSSDEIAVTSYEVKYPLHGAAVKGNLFAVKELLQKNRDPNKQDAFPSKRRKMAPMGMKYSSESIHHQNICLESSEEERTHIVYKQSFSLKKLNTFTSLAKHPIYEKRLFSQNHPTNMTLYTSFPSLPSEKESVTFIFAGRKHKALLPDLQNLGSNQRIVMVITRGEYEEYNEFSQSSYHPFLEFLVIDQLESKTHGVYENVGSIQARRLAGFLASYEWNLKHCIYLDDNIEKISLNMEKDEESLTWQDVANHMVQKRENDRAVISGLRTISNKIHSQKNPNYCYKFFSMDFQNIKEILKIEEMNDVFVLGYPGQYAMHCMQDYYFQMILDGALNHLENEKKLISVLEIEQGGLKRSEKISGTAKKANGTIEDITHIDENEFIRCSEKYQDLMKKTISLLKESAQKSLLIHKKKGEHTQKTDFSHILSHNIQIRSLSSSSSSSFYPSSLPSSLEKSSSRSSKSLGEFKIQNLHLWKGEYKFTDFFEGLDDYLNEPEISKNTYPHQKEALRKLTSRQDGTDIVEMTTGSGKTRVQILLANWLLRKNPEGVVHIVVPNLELLRQFHGDFDETLDLIGESSSIDKTHIYEISGEYNRALQAKTLLVNVPARSHGKVFLFCINSYKQFVNSLDSAEIGYHKKPLITFLDEFHLYKNTSNILLNQDQFNVIGFSATPSFKKTPIYRFSRKESYDARITVPLIVDQLSYSFEKFDQNKKNIRIIQILEGHAHPETGKPLRHKKGIIYVTGIEEANELEKNINQKLPGLAQAVHSKISNVKERIQSFKKKQQNEPGILIAVGMLTTGYDDPALSWCLIAKKTTREDTITQIAGRVVRVNPVHNGKIGYVLGESTLDTSIFEYYKDQLALETAHPAYFQRNSQIIYFEIQNAIKSGLPFEGFQALFEREKIVGHSPWKHLELLLTALSLGRNDWSQGLIQWDQSLFSLDYGRLKNSFLNEEKREDFVYNFELFQKLLNRIKDHNTGQTYVQIKSQFQSLLPTPRSLPYIRFFHSPKESSSSKKGHF